MFLTDLVDNNEVECLDEIVPVCYPGSEHKYSGYLDVYVCEYEYDTTWQVKIASTQFVFSETRHTQYGDCRMCNS